MTYSHGCPWLLEEFMTFLKSCLTSVAPVVFSFLISGVSVAQTGAPLRIVKAKDFCQRVTNTMTTLGSQQGLDTRESMRLGSKVSNAMFAQMKAGKLDQYMDAKSLQTAEQPEGEKMWFSIPEVLISAMGIAPKNVLFIDNMSDLKFTSHVMPGSQILALASNAGELNPERAKIVAKTAQALGVQVSVIWVGKATDARSVRAAQGLAMIASLTDGAFLDLSSQSACSGI